VRPLGRGMRAGSGWRREDGARRPAAARDCGGWGADAAQPRCRVDFHSLTVRLAGRARLARPPAAAGGGGRRAGARAGRGAAVRMGWEGVGGCGTRCTTALAAGGPAGVTAPAPHSSPFDAAPAPPRARRPPGGRRRPGRPGHQPGDECAGGGSAGDRGGAPGRRHAHARTHSFRRSPVPRHGLLGDQDAGAVARRGSRGRRPRRARHLSLRRLGQRGRRPDTRLPARRARVRAQPTAQLRASGGAGARPLSDAGLDACLLASPIPAPAVAACAAGADGRALEVAAGAETAALAPAHTFVPWVVLGATPLGARCGAAAAAVCDAAAGRGVAPLPAACAAAAAAPAAACPGAPRVLG